MPINYIGAKDKIPEDWEHQLGLIVPKAVVDYIKSVKPLITTAGDTKLPYDVGKLYYEIKPKIIKYYGVDDSEKSDKCLEYLIGHDIASVNNYIRGYEFCKDKLDDYLAEDFNSIAPAMFLKLGAERSDPQLKQLILDKVIEDIDAYNYFKLKGCLPENINDVFEIKPENTNTRLLKEILSELKTLNALMGKNNIKCAIN